MVVFIIVLCFEQSPDSTSSTYATLLSHLLNIRLNFALFLTCKPLCVNVMLTVIAGKSLDMSESRDVTFVRLCQESLGFVNQGIENVWMVKFNH